MLERTAGCLESSGYRVVPRLCKSASTRRMLHSSFWCHGGVEIDIPAWWFLLAQNVDARPRQQNSKNRPRNTGETFTSMFLDFLYPAQTVAFLKRCSTRNLPVLTTIGFKRRRRSTYRGFASSTRSLQKHTTTKLVGDESAGVKATTHGVRDDIGWTEGQSDDPLSAQEVTEETVIPGQQYRSPLHTLWMLLETEVDPASEDMKQTISRLDNSVPISEQIEEFCATSSSELVARHRIRLFEAIPQERRQDADYRSMMTAALQMEDIELAKSIEQSAFSHGLGLQSSSLLLSHFITEKKWLNALRLWRNRNHNFAMLSDVKQTTTFPNRLTSLLKFALALKDSDRKEKFGKFGVSLLKQITGSPKLMDIITPGWFVSTMQDFQTLERLRPSHYFAAIKTLSSLENIRSISLAAIAYRNFRWRLPSASPPRYILGLLLRSFSGTRDAVGMRYVMEQFTEFFGHPDQKAFQLCLSTYARIGDVASVKAVFDEYCSTFGRPTDLAYITPLLYVHARLGEVEKTENEFDRIPTEFGMTPNTYCWNILLVAHAQRGDLEGALQKYKEMLIQGIEPDAYTYGTLMSISADIGDTKTVQDFVELARRNNVPGTRVMLDTLVETYCQNGEMENAEDLAEAAASMGLEGARTWNIILRSYAFQRNAEAILRIQERMKELSIMPDSMTYAALMLSLIVLGKAGDAAELLRRLHISRHLTAAPFHYALVLHGYAKEGNRDMVATVYKEMLDRFGRPNLSGRLSVLQTQVNRDVENYWALKGPKGEIDLPHAEKFLEQILDEIDLSDFMGSDPQPGSKGRRLSQAFPSAFFEFMTGVFGLNNALDKSLRMFERYQSLEKHLPLIKSRSEPPSMQLLTNFMISYSKNGEYDTVEQIWNTAVKEAVRTARQHDVNYILSLDSSLSTLPEEGPPVPSLPQSAHSLSEANLLVSAPTVPSDPLMDSNLRIVPVQRFLLSRPLTQYMWVLGARKRYTDLSELVQNLQNVGFALDNANWNSYVQILSKSSDFADRFHAFEVFEEKFGSTLPHWKALRRGKAMVFTEDGTPELQDRKLAQAAHPGLLFPTYYTLIYLAASLREFSQRSSEYGGSEMETLRQRAPRTVGTILDMGHLRDKVQGILLRENTAEGDRPKRLRRGTLANAHRVLRPRYLEYNELDEIDESERLGQVYTGFLRSDRVDTIVPGMENLRRRRKRVKAESKRRAASERKIRDRPSRPSGILDEQFGDPFSVANGVDSTLSDKQEGADDAVSDEDGYGTVDEKEIATIYPFDVPSEEESISDMRHWESKHSLIWRKKGLSRHGERIWRHQRWMKAAGEAAILPESRLPFVSDDSKRASSDESVAQSSESAVGSRSESIPKTEDKA